MLPSGLPGNHQQIRSEFQHWGRQLQLKLPEPQQEDAQTLLDTVSQLHSDNAAAVKKEVRELLWKIREPLGEGTPEIRKAYEKLRNLALDNGYPCQHYCIRPRASEIANFQMVTPQFFRGGQPDQDGLNWLSRKGVDLEIDLRGSDRDNAWNPPSHFPLQKYSIAVEDFQSPRVEQVEEFIQVLDGAMAKGQTVFVHCKAGIGRTGLMTACWRISQGMSAEEALQAERINSQYGSLKQEGFVREFETYWKSKTWTQSATL